jgi:hypothetical protein
MHPDVFEHVAHGRSPSAIFAQHSAVEHASPVHIGTPADVVPAQVGSAADVVPSSHDTTMFSVAVLPGKAALHAVDEHYNESVGQITKMTV